MRIIGSTFSGGTELINNSSHLFTINVLSKEGALFFYGFIDFMDFLSDEEKLLLADSRVGIFCSLC